MNHLVKSILISILLFSSPSYSLFVDQFTNRDKPISDSVEILNTQMQTLINHTLDAANSGTYKCNEPYKSNSDNAADFLFEAIRRQLLDFPLDNFAELSKQVAKKQTLYKDSVFANVYSPLSLVNFGGKIVQTEEVINIAGHQVTTKKLARFLDDGFRLYKRQMANHQNGIQQTEKQSLSNAEKFLDGIGVLSYADHAASMAGYRFWLDLCGPSSSSDQCLPGKLITCDKKTGHWEINQANKFNFRDYIDDSWDEGINCSMYAADISISMTKNIQKVTGNKHLPCPVDPVKCFELSSSESKKYLSPICTDVADRVKKGLPVGIFTDYTYKSGVPKTPVDSTGKK